MRTETIEIPSEMTTSEEMILTTLTSLNHGRIPEAIANFAKDFAFKDHGIGLDFNGKERLAEFFQMTREFYPDSFVQVDTVSVSGDRVIVEWALRATTTEPFFGGLTRTIPISLHGVSIVRTDNGKITDWADYYDGLTARRSALASYFTEWIEL
jgi:steroid delta-isomerase-like uncharacterized protein